MKKLIISCSAFIALVVVFSSCSDDEKDPAGQFTYDGESHNLTKGFGEVDDVTQIGDDIYYDWNILLSSNGISYNEDEDDYVGTGDAVTLWISVLNDDTFLPSGTYEYDEDTGDSYGIYIDFNVEIGAGESYEDVDDTSITISKSGDTYTINFTITLGDGSEVTGSYNGSITRVD